MRIIRDDSDLFGGSGQIGVTRAIAEFHARRPVLVTAPGEAVLVLPVEGLDASRYAAFKALCRPAVPQLVITARRAEALGMEANGPVALRLPADRGVNDILALVADAAIAYGREAVPAGAAAAAAVQMVKLAHGLPAVLAAAVAADMPMAEPRLVVVAADMVPCFRDEVIRSLAIASEARVPLHAGADARFIVFRDAIGSNPVAIVVGNPDFARPVPVRLHSACLTGDVFGSRRCDCGDQLRLALARLEQAGGGIILYLAQEGRGLGLANKMRTYRMQDAGLDTVDANTTLGFDDDERDYGIAARMLHLLDCTRVVLLTNNPAKVDGLAEAGIEIAGRLSLEAPINPHNRRYLAAKAARAGHRLAHLTTHGHGA